ncbi:SMP-30/gluconolactonase/LRE family protein [Devosia sp. CAU 1758]
MRQAEIRALPDTQCQTGEGIIWCPRRHRLFFVDIAGRALCSYDPQTNSGSRWPLPEMPGCIALTEGDEIIVALPDGLHSFDPKTTALTLLVALPQDAPSGHRANDGATSRGGRLVFGTMTLGDRSIASGSLYHWDGVNLERHFSGLHIVNGLAFSPDDRTAYLSDSYTDVQTIWAFDHDPDTGALTGRREFFRTNEFAGRPDGACVDTDGCYWMAGVGGAELLRISPVGKIDLRIEVPVQWPSKPCFGSSDLRKMYVSSLRLADSSDVEGQVIEIDSPYQGLPEPVCRFRPA